MAPRAESLNKLALSPLVKWMVRGWLGSLGADVAGGVMDLLAKAFDQQSDRRRAEAVFESLAGDILRDLDDLFRREGARANLGAVGMALAQTFENARKPAELLKLNLDAQRLRRSLRPSEPNPFALDEPDLALYERALTDIAGALVKKADKLPNFDAAHAAESLGRLEQIAKELAALHGSVADVATGVRRVAGDPEGYEERYRRCAAEENDYLELFGSDIPEETKRHRLSVAYVSLALSRRGAGEGDAESVTAEHLFDRLPELGGRVLIRGEAGGGKSTLLRWATVQTQGVQTQGRQGDRHRAYIDDHRSNFFGDAGDGTSVNKPQRIDWRRIVPFLIRLRDHPEGLPPVEDFAAFAARVIGNPPPGWIVDALTEGRALVMIDGVDEVGRFDRPRCAETIGQLVKTYPQSLFVVTSRPAAVSAGWLGKHGFADAEIAPLARIDQAELVRRWHKAMAEGRPDRAADIKGLEEHLRIRLESEPALSRLGSNPLMLAMLCALHFRLTGYLPERAHTLCDKLCTLLLDERDRLSGLRNERIDPDWAKLDSARKRALLCDIAYFLITGTQSGIGSSMDLATMDAVVSRALQTFGMPHVAVTEFRQTLIERSGLLRMSAPGRIDFLHNSLKEFLAAEQFVELRLEGKLAEHAENPDWRPVLLFAAGGRSRSFADALFRKLVERQATASKTANRRLRVMAWATGAVAVQFDPALRAQHTSLEKNIVPPRSAEEADLLAEAGDHIVPALERVTPKAAKQVAATVRALRQIGTPRARELIKKRFFADKRRTVLNELVQQFNPLSLPEVKRQLLAGEYLVDGWRRYIVDLALLAELPNLVRLDLRDTGVTDVTPLSGLSNLQLLVLNGTGVTDVTPLSGLSNLQHLYLAGTGVTDVTPLSGLSNLQTLFLAGTGVTDVTPLSGLSNLQHLYLVGTGVTDVTPLSGLSNLQTLFLAGTGVTDVMPLSGLSKLQIHR